MGKFKPLEVQALERIGKNWSKSKLTREGHLQHTKEFAIYVAKRFGLERIEHLKPGHVQAYVAHLHERGLNHGTIANRLASVRQLAQAIGKANIVERTNDAYGVMRTRMNPVIADRDKIDQIKSELKTMADNGDRVAMMTYAASLLRDAFGLRAKESIMSAVMIQHEGKLFLRVEGAKGGRTRDLEIKTPDQLSAAHNIEKVAALLGSATGRVIPPELSLKEAYNAQRALWASLGGTRENRTHMHAQRHDHLQVMHANGATNAEMMKQAGHGEDRSPGHYIPK
ncbi:integrase domain-containing protein [Trichlorobacter lovleyi]|uniref:phage integrase N-terminal domain-containing protein n=1 Tax=Trichlorobacter lovleyi TaxID=313985 RepID=UPI0022402600|nr:phage integrase N-terminal domain-containing protein [Trichlorobacter lovleyi]QOX78655.1 integrase domain-containing protein [Trichlorobacter lovleyi]